MYMEKDFHGLQDYITGVIVVRCPTHGHSVMGKPLGSY